MKNLIVSLFIAVSSFSIYDTNDPKKVIIAVEYTNGWVDKVLVDRKEINRYNGNIWKVIEKIINERERYE